MRKYSRVLVIFFLCIAVTSQFAYALTVTEFHKPGLTDPDKPRTGSGGGIDPDYTNTCALASTANMLWAAGYRMNPDGTTATSAQDLFQNIVTAVGNVAWTYAAEIAWMQGYFANNVAEKDNLYKVITSKWTAGLMTGDMFHLFDELKRCQFVEISIKRETGVGIAHSIVLEGFKITYDDDGNIVSIEVTIQDPDQDAGLFGNDPYMSLFDGSKKWYLEDYYGSATDAIVIGYKTLCPIPEPVTVLAVLLGVAGLARYIRKRRFSAAA